VSLATVRAAVAVLLRAVSGVENVYEETPTGFDASRAAGENRPGGLFHRWVVRATPGPGDGGAGYIDPRCRISITGELGVARDNPGLGVPSDGTAAALLADVCAMLESPANAHPGGAIDREEPIVIDPPRVVSVPDGIGEAQVHQLRVTATYIYPEA